MRLFGKKKEERNSELKAILACLEKEKESEIRMPIKAAVMFEALSGKKFSEALKDPSDLLVLMYCAFVCSTGLEISMEAFGGMLENDRFSKKLSMDLKRFERFTEQFQGKNVENEEEKQPENVEVSITEMADKMIFYYGIDARYVMNDMQIWELEHFMKGAEAQYKEKMEEQRLWTFMQVAPQIDLKKCKSPEKFMPFPWDLKDKKARKEKELGSETARAKSTIGMEIKLF